MKPRALDLFCCEGGATRGLQLAGFHVTGVDIKPRARYVGDAFIEGDALLVELDGYDLVWASPPCQRYTMYARNLGTAHRHPDLVGPIRERLLSCGSDFIIENVPGAPLRADVVLCGSMFGLNIIRHRLFEITFPVGLVPQCRHTGLEIPVYGNGTPQWHRERLGRNVHVAEQRVAMGIDWMTRDGLVESIPPAYSEFLGRAALKHIKEAA